MLRSYAVLLVATAAILGCSGVGTRAWAEGSDCPFVGQLPVFQPNAQGPQWQRYDMHTMWEPGPKVERGKICTIRYDKKPGSDPMSDLEVDENYKEQLTQEGAEITNGDEVGKIWAHLQKDDKNYWIEVRGNSNGAGVVVLEVQPVQNLLLPPSGNDYRLIGHMQGFEADPPQKSNYDEYTTWTHSGAVNVRGYKYSVQYHLVKGGTRTSQIELNENYRAALTAIGAELVYGEDEQDLSWLVGRLDDNGKTVWITLRTGEDAYSVIAVEEKPFVASIKPPQASEMKSALDAQGRIALYINFDFNKASLKPDAQPIIAQVVQLLNDNPDLKVSIDGHTDSVGLHDYNVKLSQDRAASVVEAIKAAGIDGARLSSQGFGPDKPIAPNDKEEGRAKNRRVELVKQ